MISVHQVEHWQAINLIKDRVDLWRYQSWVRSFRQLVILPLSKHIWIWHKPSLAISDICNYFALLPLKNSGKNSWRMLANTKTPVPHYVITQHCSLCFSIDSNCACNLAWSYGFLLRICMCAVCYCSWKKGSLHSTDIFIYRKKLYSKQSLTRKFISCTRWYTSGS